MLKLCLFKANDLSKSTLHLFKVTWILLLGSLVHICPLLSQAIRNEIRLNILGLLYP